MTWSYDPAEPTDRDRVRGRVGDTQINDPLLANETIDALLASTPSIAIVALDACERIIARLARDVDRSAIGISTGRSAVIQHYQDLRQILRRAVASGAVEIFVGGLSTARDDARLEDDDYRGPWFRAGEDDHP